MVASVVLLLLIQVEHMWVIWVAALPAVVAQALVDVITKLHWHTVLVLFDWAQLGLVMPGQVTVVRLVSHVLVVSTSWEAAWSLWAHVLGRSNWVLLERRESALIALLLHRLAAGSWRTRVHSCWFTIVLLDLLLQMESLDATILVELHHQTLRILIKCE